MPRTVPIPPPPLKAPALETWTLRLRTITPMFGGSATPRQVDPEHPVRAASVRGHLRFWWRATAGAQYATAKELFEAEERIWGSAKKQGQVALTVSEQGYENTLQPSSLGERVKPYERFFVYPFLRNKNDSEASGLVGVSFSLELRLSNSLTLEEEAEVKTAVRAWLAFGGVGARTRRGLGALQVVSSQTGWHPKDLSELKGWFAGLQSNGYYSCLSGARATFSKPYKDGVRAWKDLSIFWARFRKGHYTGKYPEYSAMGGAMWEDHAKLKALTPGQKVSLAKPYMGLPIIYQKFTGAFAGEITPADGSRMASPVLLKPVAFADGSVRAMVLVLSAPEPQGVSVKGQTYDLSWPTDDRVVRALGGKDLIETVLRAAQKEGFTEEVRL
ncbi:MAG: type III-B CRISPR module RAMP protein Cmr1 [Meiothermus sp.]|uniref:type III-B CRISPR module RAMP protein Cmr1 n=1 Tax=Meiothermus sp. TaxID=1955249 RepID=UPI0021DD249D|nr:type III-B CRISPR module RAMP protein Cmr1 [Meiothermus sp.]GIW27670.1 MAG: type III-B CRISPR module RAMP protein Cmr1 [Meiothermus sp.]